MGIVRIVMMVDENKDASCYKLRHEAGEGGEGQKNRWDTTSEDEKNEVCSKCPLAWNRGFCEGKFGPTYSSLPSFAKRFGCDIIADIPKSYEKRVIFSPPQAQRLLEEVGLLREKLKFEKDTVFIPKENESLPEEKIEQWLAYTVGFDGVVTRKINALRVHEATLTQLENMAKTCVEHSCSFTFS
ncbi:MAG: hypothetical protein WED04_00535 [Promethearchaeati archaeon SRVP18_Atabeyarchaeia-1]